MPTTSRLTKPAGYLPESVVRALRAQNADGESVPVVRRAAGLAYIVAYALLPMVIALVAAAFLHDWGTAPKPTSIPAISGASTLSTPHLVPAHAVAAGTTQARVRSAETERPGNPGAERTGETAATPLSSPLGSR